MNYLTSFIEFAKYFECSYGILKRRKKPDQLIIITLPKVKYNKENPATHSIYCYYQLIKYSSWTAETYKNITKDNSIMLWEQFIKTASNDVIETIRYSLLCILNNIHLIL